MNEICLTCGDEIAERWSHNPMPINDSPGLEDRRVCGDCNGMYVIPARMGHKVNGDLYGTDGTIIGSWGTKK